MTFHATLCTFEETGPGPEDLETLKTPGEKIESVQIPGRPFELHHAFTLFASNLCICTSGHTHLETPERTEGKGGYGYEL
jgi:hypothetical protein